MDDTCHRLAVDGVFQNEDGDVILVRSKRRGWVLPGGQADPGENVFEALAREVAEESSCEVDVDNLVAVSSNVGQDVIVLTFRGRWRAGTPQGGHEIAEAAFFPIEQAREVVTHGPSAARLERALSFTGRPIYHAYASRPYELLLEREL